MRAIDVAALRERIDRAEAEFGPQPFTVVDTPQLRTLLASYEREQRLTDMGAVVCKKNPLMSRPYIEYEPLPEEFQPRGARSDAARASEGAAPREGLCMVPPCEVCQHYHFRGDPCHRPGCICAHTPKPKGLGKTETRVLDLMGALRKSLANKAEELKGESDA